MQNSICPILSVYHLFSPIGEVPYNTLRKFPFVRLLSFTSYHYQVYWFDASDPSHLSCYGFWVVRGADLTMTYFRSRNFYPNWRIFVVGNSSFLLRKGDTLCFRETFHSFEFQLRLSKCEQREQSFSPMP